MKPFSRTVIAFALAAVLSLSAAEARKKTEPAPAPTPAPRAEPKPQGLKKRVGIVTFENKSRYGQGRLSASATDAMYSELEKTGVFLIYERENLDKLDREHDLIDSGRVNLNTAAEYGKLTGIQLLVMGTVTQFGVWEEAKDYGVYKKKVEISEATVDVRVVDVTTGRVIFSDSGTGRTERALETVLGFGDRASFDETMADKALRAALVQFMGRLVETVGAVPWEGRVADVDKAGGEERVYINAGLRSGMTPGLAVEIKQVVGEVTDPVTQEFMGYKTRLLGRGRVIELTGEDLSIAVMDSPAGVQRGDLVTLPR